MNSFYKPYRTISFHNKFGYPESILGRFDKINSILYYWYIDTEKYDNYIKASSDKNIILPKEEIDHNYWKNFIK